MVGSAENLLAFVAEGSGAGGFSVGVGHAAAGRTTGSEFYGKGHSLNVEEDQIRETQSTGVFGSTWEPTYFGFFQKVFSLRTSIGSGGWCTYIGSGGCILLNFVLYGWRDGPVCVYAAFVCSVLLFFEFLHLRARRSSLLHMEEEGLGREGE